MPSVKKLIKSFQYAGEGLFFVIKNEQNFRLEIIGAIAVFFGMFYFDIDWIKIILAGFLLFAILLLEILNTIFEELTDFLTEQPRMTSKTFKSKEKTHNVYNIRIKIIKDLAAGMVLLSGIFFALLALAIFGKI